MAGEALVKKVFIRTYFKLPDQGRTYEYILMANEFDVSYI